MHEIDVNELLNMIREDKIEEDYLINIIGEDKLDELLDNDWEFIEWIRNNMSIQEEQKEMLKDALFKEDEYDLYFISPFAAALLEKNEIKNLIQNEEYKFDGFTYACLIGATGEAEAYLTPEQCKKFGINWEVEILIKSTGRNGSEYTLKELIELGVKDSNMITESIKAHETIEDYLTVDKINEFGLYHQNVVELIRATGKIDEYLMGDKKEKTKLLIKESKLFHIDIVELIKATGKTEEYLDSYLKTADEDKIFELYSPNIAELIKATGKIEEYLIGNKKEKVKLFRENYKLFSEDIAELIKVTGKIEDYLTADKIKELGLYGSDIVELIKETGKIEDYLTADKIKELGLYGSDLAKLIRETGGIEKYISKKSVEEFGFDGNSIVTMIGLENEIILADFIDNEIQNDVYNPDKVMEIFNVIQELEQSNSGRLDRIKTEIAIQVYTLETEEEKRNAIKNIKEIFLTKNLPTFAQDFLVFKQLHPQLIGNSESVKMDQTYQMIEIPSLMKIDGQARNRMIFTDLLRINLESNNRNLREYLDKFDESSIETQIAKTLKSSLKILGIESFSEAKDMMESISSKVSKKNKNRAKNGEIQLKEGDLVKGISDTRYFPGMLQKGIVAKDYLGGNADSDATPCDTDCELITEEGENFSETYEKIKTAKGYINTNESGKNLGKIILVFEKDERFIKTRTGTEIDEEACKTVVQDPSKIEYFDNNGKGGSNAYGIRTGVGSTSIKCIISDKYVDKLALEIALNGFYIPVVDETGKVIYTPEMYEEFRSKMQGLSHYGLTEFQLDESAKNEGTKQLIGLIEESKDESENKRAKILQTLKIAIEEQGLTLSETREDDLLPGIVEIIDTGSTGRGTNEPGDGDFDFMVKIDKSIINDEEKFKEFKKRLREELSDSDEKTETCKGDFRYKGVSIEGIDPKVDIDLTFAKRTDEIEYTTDESIKDRLETIKKNNPEDYKYVVANILLAKKVLKTEGAYKKSNAAEPKPGEIDTRGGIGAVGIENWVLQNGGSFEKAARSFLEVAEKSKTLEEFQSQYAIWDFGENHTALEQDGYPHDNFVNNMNPEGFEKMKKALGDYVRAVLEERDINANEISTMQEDGTDTGQKSLGDLVREDLSVLNDTTYMKSVESLLNSAKKINNRSVEVQESNI